MVHAFVILSPECTQNHDVDSRRSLTGLVRK